MRKSLPLLPAATKRNTLRTAIETIIWRRSLRCFQKKKKKKNQKKGPLVLGKFANGLMHRVEGDVGQDRAMHARIDNAEVARSVCRIAASVAVS